MPKPIEKLLLIVVDFLMTNLAFWGLIRLRSSFNLFVEQGLLLQIFVLVYLFWLILFLFFGLYQSWYVRSRFDELILVFKAVLFGTFLIIVLTFEPERDLSNPPTFGRMMILSYSALMLCCVGGGRLALHTIQRQLLQAGIGLRNTLIIGWNAKARKLADKIKQFPALGYHVVGFVSLDGVEPGTNYQDLPVLGPLSKVTRLIKRHKIEEVILALGKMPQKSVMQIIGQFEEFPVHIKIEPDLYNIVMGRVHTEQIYGFPLIDIDPQLMQPWETRLKRIIDITVSLTALIIMTPVFVLVAILIKIDSRGPVFFKQKRVGKNGRIFIIYKFRTMIKDAERYTGPVWADKRDPRITRLGRVLRKLRIDEFPQLFNVLNGEMSLVGPRPERPYFVDRLRREYPFYTRRLKVQPGITGWAQVKGKYDTTVEEAKEKIQYDLYYIENMSLRMDLRILMYTISVMLRFRGQ